MDVKDVVSEEFETLVKFVEAVDRTHRTQRETLVKYINRFRMGTTRLSEYAEANVFGLHIKEYMSQEPSKHNPNVLTITLSEGFKRSLTFQILKKDLQFFTPKKNYSCVEVQSWIIRAFFIQNYMFPKIPDDTDIPLPDMSGYSEEDFIHLYNHIKLIKGL